MAKFFANLVQTGTGRKRNYFYSVPILSNGCEDSPEKVQNLKNRNMKSSFTARSMSMLNNINLRKMS